MTGCWVHRGAANTRSSPTHHSAARQILDPHPNLMGARPFPTHGGRNPVPSGGVCAKGCASSWLRCWQPMRAWRLCFGGAPGVRWLGPVHGEPVGCSSPHPRLGSGAPPALPSTSGELQGRRPAHTPRRVGRGTPAHTPAHSPAHSPAHGPTPAHTPGPGWSPRVAPRVVPLELGPEGMFVGAGPGGASSGHGPQGKTGAVLRFSNLRSTRRIAECRLADCRGGH